MMNSREVERVVYGKISKWAAMIGKDKAVVTLKYHARGKKTNMKKAGVQLDMAFIYHLFGPQALNV
jgi:hypothetical protein